ncbi:phosphatidylethanolamine-binding protein [Gymnopilus junonius]|uniref:Phosphatidylethanolamine-binding protein n=1 Tax=Gymnopilus junonius TaxID=109634 RepID=A0A9P5NYC1_GYMJU|nr:phosphatidylethanolamine-binding protein [Gymnopilus junonius]
MFGDLLSLAFLLLPHAFAQVATPDLSNVTTAFSSAQIVPDVLQSFNPGDVVNITFTDPVTMENEDVVPGILLTTEQTSVQPDIFLIPSGINLTGNTSFVVTIVDPDAPTPQNHSISQFLHFLGGDFTPDPTSGLLSNSSPNLMEFIGPAPPAGSDPHRYVLLVYSQPGGFDTNAPTLVNSSTPRNNFNISTFAQAVDLGDPVAGNYFLVGPTPNASTSTQAPSTTTQSTPTAPAPAPSSLTPMNSIDMPPLAVPTAAPSTTATSSGTLNEIQLLAPQMMTFMVAVLLALL